MNNRIFQDNQLETLFLKEEDPFKFAQEIEGKTYRDYANRKTKKFSHEGSSYFLKYHGPVGWIEIFKNLLQFKIPVVGAEREWNAILKLQSINVSCPEPVALMTSGWNPANQKSFLITKDLEGTISLEDFFIKKENLKMTFHKKRILLRNIASICRTMHLHGLNHRDLYLCHFHIKKEGSYNLNDISLIDLHRSQIRKRVPKRWATKDIGGLLHSVIQFGISETDCYRFLMVYFDCSLRELLKDNKDFIEKSRYRAYTMYMKPIKEEISLTDKKSLPFSSDYKKEFGRDYRWIGKKELLTNKIIDILKDLDGAMSKGKIIKHETGHFIVSLNLEGREIFIKKYQIKSAWHLVRKVFSKSRAYNSWLAIHWLRSAGISTVDPIVVYERFNFCTTLDSYLITNSIEGDNLDTVCNENKKDFIIAARMHSFFKRLQWIGFNHGDAKTSNFFIDKEDLVVFDLDVAKRRLTNFMVKRKIKRDIERMLRSVKENKRLHKLMKKRLDVS
jgi:heptose I phosphotransferase|tara:strand:- start:2048 stop:3556 length:1509 start_codon:yes stop_codon:yes gene_type:complete